MKIAILSRRLSGHGGMETIIKTLSEVLVQASSFDNLLICDFNSHHNQDNTWLKTIPHKEFSIKAPRPCLNYIYAYLLAKYIDTNNIDKIICCDEYCVRIASNASKKSQHHPIVISWLHFSIDQLTTKRQRWLKNADHHLAICSQIADQLEQVGIESSKIHIFHNCVTRPQYIINPDPSINRFLYLGRITFEGQKRVSDIFYALREIPSPWELHIVGSGNLDDIENLKALSTSLNISQNIIWHGWKQDPWNYIQTEIKTISALIAASEYEGFPMTLLEALARGIPCIYSDCLTGPRDAIIPGKNGYLFKPTNIEDLIASINKLLTDGIVLTRNQIQDSLSSFYLNNYQAKVKNTIIDSCD